MNNKQQIEQFIKAHRAALDLPFPAACGWESIERNLSRWERLDDLEQWAILNRPCLDTAAPSAIVWEKINHTLDTIQNDPLEQFIRTNRDEFELEAPTAKLWDQIPSTAPPQALRVSWIQQLSRVAAAVVLLAAGTALGIWYSGSSFSSDSGMKMAEVSKEYAELEGHYEREIAVKQQELTRFASNPSSSEVWSDLSQMDKVMEELRLELANVPPGNREQIVRAMIENYKTKAVVLERVLKALEQNGQDNQETDQNSKSNKHESESI